MSPRWLGVFLGVVAAAVGIALATYNTNAGNVFYEVLYGALVGAAWLAVRRVPRGAQRWPWILVAVTQTLWLAGDTIEVACYYLGLSSHFSSNACWMTGYLVRRRAAAAR